MVECANGTRLRSVFSHSTVIGNMVSTATKIVAKGFHPMSRTATTYTRLAWNDRYNQPTPEQLRAGLNEEPGKHFDALRAFLRELDDVSETTAWYGECWRWTVEYRLANHEEPLALLIPSPEDLQLALPINPDMTDSLPARPLKRAVREGLELGLDPFDTRWGVWSISYPKLVDELASLIQIKLTTITGQKPKRRRS